MEGDWVANDEDHEEGLSEIKYNSFI